MACVVVAHSPVVDDMSASDCNLTVLLHFLWLGWLTIAWNQDSICNLKKV
jgi:hypothetical protein